MLVCFGLAGFTFLIVFSFKALWDLGKESQTTRVVSEVGTGFGPIPIAIHEMNEGINIYEYLKSCSSSFTHDS